MEGSDGEQSERESEEEWPCLLFTWQLELQSCFK